MKKLLLGVMLIACTISFTNAQTKQAEVSKWSFALKAGADYFRVTPTRAWDKDFNWAAGLTLERTVNPLFGWGLDVTYLNFKNGLDEAGTTLDPSFFTSFNLSNLFLPHRASASWNIYAKLGTGVGIQTSALGSDIADKYDVRALNPTLYTGLSLEKNLSRRVALGLDATYRGYMAEEVGGLTSKDRHDDALSLMATLRFKLGSLASHVRDMTMDQFYPAPAPVEKNIENPYDDSALKSGLDNASKKLGDLESRLAALEQGLKDLAAKDAAASTTVSFQNIEFEFDSDKLTNASYSTLDQIITILKNNPTWGKLAIKGNTDNVGPDAYNQKLSEKRANSVKKYLVSKGISESVLSAVGYGETKPIASNDTAEGRQQNRRVDFEISK